MRWFTELNDIELRKEFIPIWVFLVAVQRSLETIQLTPEQKQAYLKLLDECHDVLSHAIEITEKMANEIQMSLPKEWVDRNSER